MKKNEDIPEWHKYFILFVLMIAFVLCLAAVGTNNNVLFTGTVIGALIIIVILMGTEGRL